MNVSDADIAQIISMTPATTMLMMSWQTIYRTLLTSKFDEHHEAVQAHLKMLKDPGAKSWVPKQIEKARTSGEIRANLARIDRYLAKRVN